MFKFLIDSSGAIAPLVYLVIAVPQLRMRKKFCVSRRKLNSLAHVLYPWLTWLVTGFTTFVLVVMLFRPAQQLADLYRLIGDRDYLYSTDYGALEKAGIVAKNTRSQYALIMIRVTP
ncbi:hypothetical protein OHD25_01135 [Escherichia coli]|nr:hypothetical protein [Escherichia coli]